LKDTPAAKVDLVFEHILDKKEAYFFDGTIPTTTISDPAQNGGWSTVSEVSLVSYANKVGVMGGSILDATKDYNDSVPLDQIYNTPEIIDEFNRRFNDPTAGQKVSSAVDAIGFFNDIASGVTDVMTAFANDEGVYNIVLERKYVNGDPIYRWSAYYQVDESQPKTYLKGANGKLVMERLLGIARDVEEQG
jgi:hypothetical protein